MVMIYSEAAIALACWLGLLFADPGEIQRSIENSLPVPEAIVSAPTNE